MHRDFEQTLDVSADLEELSLTPVAVVCAGVKSILDIPRTLEYLETKGVPVIGFGCDEFPAFYTPFSGIKAPLRMNLPEETAQAGQNIIFSSEKRNMRFSWSANFLTLETNKIQNRPLALRTYA